MVCYYTASEEEDITPDLLELLCDCCGGVLPPLTLVPVPHMQTGDSTVEILGCRSWVGIFDNQHQILNTLSDYLSWTASYTPMPGCLNAGRSHSAH